MVINLHDLGKKMKGVFAYLWWDLIHVAIQTVEHDIKFRGKLSAYI